MPLERLGNEIIQMPDFIHEFGHYPDSDNPLLHEGVKYKNHVPTNFVRHRAVEKVLYKLRIWLTNLDAMVGYKIFDMFLDILFGLNCKFPLKDIALYAVWQLGECKPIAVREFETSEEAERVLLRLKLKYKRMN